MFCPQCGNEIHEDESYFCPYCGQNLSPSNSTSLETERHGLSSRLSPEGGRPKTIIAALGVIAILILASALIVVYNHDDDPQNTPVTSTPSDSAIVNGDGSYIELDGGFSNGTMFAYKDADGRLIIYLDSTLKQKYSHFVWILRDNMTETYSVSPKNESEMIWMSPDPGIYEVIVHCYLGKYDTHYAESYSGSIEYHGDMLKEYIWTFENRLFSMSVSIPVDEYIEFSSKGASDASSRHSSDPNDIVGFISTGGVVSKVGSKLSDTYAKSYGIPQPGEQRYAEFILSFVQSSISFSYDSVSYGYSEYNAFPVETLYRGIGDSNDSSILCASLFAYAGYDSGLLYLPDKTMAAVSLKYSGQSETVNGYHSLTISNGGKTFVMADTASSGPVPLGYISDRYGYNSITKTFQYFGQDCDRTYGLYV